MVSIGRGFNNDIILSDPYVSDAHVQVEKTEAGFCIKDCNSSNGTFIEKNQPINISTIINSGECFYIGKTRIIIYDPNHPVVAAKHFVQDSFFMELLKKTNWLSTLFFLTVFVVLYWTDGVIDLMDKEPFLKMLIPSLSFTILIFFCAGFWTSIGLLVKKKNNFHKQFAIVSLFFSVGLILSYLSSYAGFLLSSEVINTSLLIISELILFFIVIQLTLRFATNISKKVSLIVAGSLCLMLFLPVSIVSAEKYLDFNQLPVYSSYLFPPAVKFVIAKTPDLFLKDCAKLFSN